MNYGQTDSQLRIDSVVRIQDQNLESHKKTVTFMTVVDDGLNANGYNTGGAE